MNFLNIIKVPRTSFLVVILLLLSSCAPQFKKHYLSSELKGLLVIDNKPVSGVTIIRFCKSDWYDEEPVIDSVKTDKKGIFFFEERTNFASFSLIHQPVIKQFLTIRINNKECEEINLGKMNYDKNGEFNPLHKSLGEGIKLYVKNDKLKLDIFLEKKDTIP